MSLTFVEPRAGPPSLNIVLYGPEGVGKTTNAYSAPGPVLGLNAEDRNALSKAREVYGDAHIREVVVEGPQVLDEVALYLASGEGGERSIVVDSASSIYRALVTFYAGRGRPTLPNYGDAAYRLERFVMGLRDLPINVVLIAHELMVPNEQEAGIERLPYTGSGRPDLGVRIMAQYDIVGYVGRVAPETEGGDARYMAQLFPGLGRRGKKRGGHLPDVADIDIAAWVAAQPGGTAYRQSTRARARTA